MKKLIKNLVYCNLFLLTSQCLYAATIKKPSPPSRETSISAADYSAPAADYSFMETYDNIRMQSLLMTYRQRESLAQPEGSESEKAWDIGTSVLTTYGYSSQDAFTGQRILALMGYKFSKSLQLDFSSGGHLLENQSTGENTSRFAGQLKGSFLLGDIFSGYVGVNQDYAYLFFLQAGSIRDHLTATDLNSGVNIQFNHNLQARIQESYLFISDSNRKLYLNASLLYGIPADVPWLWVGFGAEKTSFKNQSPSYYSPSDFINVGPRGEAVFPIIKDKLFTNSALSFGRTWDRDSNEYGNAYTISERITYGMRTESNVSVFYTHNHTVVGISDWYSNEVGLSVNLML